MPPAVVVDRPRHVKTVVAGETCESVPLVGAMFNDGHAVSRQKCGQTWNDAPIAGESVRTAIDGEIRLMEGDFRIEAGQVGARHIGRIGNDKIECRVEGGSPVSAHDPGTVSNTMAAHVAGRHCARPLTDVDADSRAPGPGLQERDHKTSRSSAKIEDACRRAVFKTVKTAFDERFAVRTRDQGVHRDLEIEAPEFAHSGDPREGFTPRPPGDQGSEMAVFPGRKDPRIIAADDKLRQKPGLSGRIFDTGGTQLRSRSPQGVIEAGRRHVSQALPAALPGRWISAVR